MRANTDQCSSPDGMAVELTSDCSGLETEFVYNPDTSKLYSKCQNMILCTDAIAAGQYLRVKNTCSHTSSQNRWDIGICKLY